MLALGKSAVLASMILGSCLNPLAAQEPSSDLAFVETVTGRAVALVSGRPTLLGPLDVITNRSRVDVVADSELGSAIIKPLGFYGQRTRLDHRFRR
jgi:hypothetical protein